MGPTRVFTDYSCLVCSFFRNPKNMFCYRPTVISVFGSPEMLSIAHVMVEAPTGPGATAGN